MRLERTTTALFMSAVVALSLGCNVEDNEPEPASEGEQCARQGAIEGELECVNGRWVTRDEDPTPDVGGEDVGLTDAGGGMDADGGTCAPGTLGCPCEQGVCEAGLVCDADAHTCRLAATEPSAPGCGPVRQMCDGAGSCVCARGGLSQTSPAMTSPDGSIEIRAGVRTDTVLVPMSAGSLRVTSID